MDSAQKGADDAILAGEKIQFISKEAEMEFRETVRANLQRPKPTSSSRPRTGPIRPVVSTGGDLYEQMEAVRAILPDINLPPNQLFVRNGDDLVRVVSGRRGEASIRSVGKDLLKGLLAEKMRFVKIFVTKDGDEKEIPTNMPEALAKCMHAAPESYGLPHVTRVTMYPAMRPDATVNSTPGYDPATETYYKPMPGMEMREVSADPSKEEIQEAVDLILDKLFGDFKFREDGLDWHGNLCSASRAHALSLTLEHVAASQIEDIKPPYLGQAGSPGSGKSLLIRCALIAGTGMAPDEMSTPRSDNEEEWTKQVARCLRSSPAGVLIDNVRGAGLDSATMDKAFTSSLFSARQMNTLDSLFLDNNKVWAATSNNAEFRQDTARRFVYINLEKNTDKTYQEKTLRIWTIKNAHRFAWAVRTIVRGWVSAGRPKWRSMRPDECKGLDGAEDHISYEEWADVMGGILDWLGVPGFLTNAKKSQSGADIEGGDADEFFLAMANKFPGETPFSSSEAAALLEYEAEFGTRHRLGSAIPIPSGETWRSRSVQTKLGKWLTSHRDQVREGIRLTSVKDRGKSFYYITNESPAVPSEMVIEDLPL
jgi:hypothetical protein